MPIADAQVHIWGANTPERPWPARHEPHRPVPLGKDELLAEMDKAGVDRAVLVPPSWEGDRNDLALEAAAAHPTRYAIMGRFDPDWPGAREQVARWRKQPGMLGMRFTFHREQLRQPLLDGHFDWLWGEMEKAGIPAMVLFHHEYMHLADRIAERHPGLRLILDHLGLKSDKGFPEKVNFATLDKVLALAKRPNVAAKVSALPCYVDDKTYPFRSAHPHIRRVFDAFGPQRTFWGTDLSRLPCSYRQGVTMFTEELPWLSAVDREWVMGRGLCDWIGWRT
jgi:predicted TIM-barrel fold metal-dependent hydrolase